MEPIKFVKRIEIGKILVAESGKYGKWLAIY